MATVQNVNFVEYGRRKGKEKLLDKKQVAEKQEFHQTLHLPNGTDLRQVKVLRREEYNRIQENLFGRQRALEAEEKARLEKQKYHQEAKELVKTWPNTIMGDRKMRLNAKKLREEEDEKRRQEKDIEEAKYLAEVRRNAIEQAKTKQLFQTERVRGFHSALMLTETLKERDLQIALKKKMTKPKNDPEELKRIKEQYDQEVAKEKEIEFLKWKQRKTTQTFQIDQIKKRAEEEKQENEEDMKEGRRIRNLHKLFELEQEEGKKSYKAKQKETMAMYNKIMFNKNSIKALEKEKNDEEDEEIRLWTESKRTLNKKMFERELQRRKKAEERTAKLGKHLNDFRVEFQSRFRKGEDYLAADQDERDIKKAAEKARKLAAMKKAIKEHRLEQIKNAEMDAKIEKQDNRKGLKLRIAADEKARQDDREKAAEFFRRANNVDKFRFAQINERAEAERQNLEFDLIAEKTAVEQANKDEQQFKEYAEKVIEEAKVRDCNIYPLVKAAKDGFGGGHGPLFVERGLVRPSYMCSDKAGVELAAFSGDAVANPLEGAKPIGRRKLGFW